ncbi:MAG: RNA-binding S4 domain-containing protein [Burkholderiaceae bacterium]|nr:RNA-binding S4 domain-containing protein [Burkholderiaceae bacterium]
MPNRPVPDDALPGAGGGVRIDKWLWAARFFRTRSLAQQAIEKGRVLVAGERVKLARPVRIGDEVSVRIDDVERTVRVLGLSETRGPAPVAQALYRESDESIARRAGRREARRLYAEPAAAIEGGRPTKRDRRRLGRVGAAEGQ